jgi:hypothetical protein
MVAVAALSSIVSPDALPSVVFPLTAKSFVNDALPVTFNVPPTVVLLEAANVVNEPAAAELPPIAVPLIVPL